MKIGISGSFTAMNYLTLYKDIDAAKYQEGWLVGGHGLKPAAECIKCGKCEQVCPQHISMRSELEKVAEAFNGQKCSFGTGSFMNMSLKEPVPKGKKRKD